MTIITLELVKLAQWAPTFDGMPHFYQAAVKVGEDDAPARYERKYFNIQFRLDGGNVSHLDRATPYHEGYEKVLIVQEGGVRALKIQTLRRVEGLKREIVWQRLEGSVREYVTKSNRRRA
jgi:hypothetical protein